MGITSVRLFPEWNGLENPEGAWHWEKTDAMLAAAQANGLAINAILMGSTPWVKGAGSHAFPMDHLEEWSRYVSAVVGRYKGQVKTWEVWNEGNAGFNDGKHNTGDYARLASATYSAAKQADPQAQVGLSVASFDAPFLRQAILAQKGAGTPDRFDFLAIHPYEIADGVGHGQGEIPYLWMSSLLRSALQKEAPGRLPVPIWMTEVGRHIKETHGAGTRDEEAARVLPKLYTMALAQGIARVQWFEAQDAPNEEAGYGLLKRDGTPRGAALAYQTMTKALGPQPQYLGWVALGAGGRGFGFVFHAAPADVLVAWMPEGSEDRTVTLPGDVSVIDALTAETKPLPAAQPLTLTDTPVYLVGLPADWVTQARARAGQPFPWGGHYAGAKVVSLEPGRPDGAKGVFQVATRAKSARAFEDGSLGLDVEPNQASKFWVHPSFADGPAHEYYVRVTVRRTGLGNVGMNLHYEVADSQGRAPYKNRGEWFGLTDETGWQTHTWKVTDACFSKMWGYDFSLVPEKSVAFALGKVEISTEPFAP